MPGDAVRGEAATPAGLPVVEPDVALFGPYDPLRIPDRSGCRRRVPDAGQIREGRDTALYPDLHDLAGIEAGQPDDRQAGHQGRHRSRHEFSPPQHRDLLVRRFPSSLKRPPPGTDLEVRKPCPSTVGYVTDKESR